MKKKLLALISLIAVMGIFAGIAVYFQKEANSDLKTVHVEVISQRDNYEKTTSYKTDKEYLRELLEEENIVTNYEDSDYGMYIHGVENMNDDSANQYWWCILVNDESATTSADSIVLEDGTTYTLELKQGY